MTDLEKARRQVAARYGHGVTDSMGREHRSIPAEAVLRGDWDAGALVREALTRPQG